MACRRARLLLGGATRQRHRSIVHGAVTDFFEVVVWHLPATLPSTLPIRQSPSAPPSFLLTYYLVAGRNAPLEFANAVAEQEVVSWWENF